MAVTTSTERTRTVLHGVDQSAATFEKLPEKGHWGHVCMTEDLLGLHVWDNDDLNWKPVDYIPFCFDTRVDGMGVGWYGLDVTVPAGTIILDGILDIVEQFLSDGSATLGLKVESAAGGTDDLINAVAVASLTQGLYDITPQGLAATAIKVTADREIKAQVGTADFTAGKVYGYLRCLRGFVNVDVSSSSSSSQSASSSSSSSSSASASSSSSSQTTSSSSLSSQTTSSSSQTTSSQSASSSSSSSQSSSSHTTSSSSQSVSSSSSSSSSGA